MLCQGHGVGTGRGRRIDRVCRWRAGKPVAGLVCDYLLGAVFFFAMDEKSGAVVRDRSAVGFLLVARAAAAKIYYSDTVKNIILADCARCHSGAVNNLMDYDRLKSHADSGVWGLWRRGQWPALRAMT